MVNKLHITAIMLAILCGLAAAKEFYQFPQVNDVQSRDVYLLRRPAKPGFTNNTGTRNIPASAFQAVFQTRSAATAQLAGKVSTTDPRLTDARVPLDHTQPISSITNLQSSLDAKLSPTGNGSGLTGITATQVSGLANVAKTGSWADVLNKPSIPATPSDIGLVETCTGRVSYDGQDGTNGKDGSVIYTGSILPASEVGLENDFYVRSNGDYYRKEGSPVAWVLKGNLLGPPNTLSIGTITTGAAGSAASCTITGTSPNQVLSCSIPQGAPGDPGTISREQIRVKLAEASDSVIYVQPATNSGASGGLVINDYLGNAAVILRNGSVEVRDASGVAIAKIDRATASVSTFDAAGLAVVTADRTGLYGYYATGVAGFSWARSTGSLVLK